MKNSLKKTVARGLAKILSKMVYNEEKGKTSTALSQEYYAQNTLPRVTLWDTLYIIDEKNKKIINFYNRSEVLNVFDTKEELWKFIEDLTDLKRNDIINHIYTSHKAPAFKEPPKYTLQEKMKHKVFEWGDFVVLKLPLDTDFVQREGISMSHCLSVAQTDYVDRMKKGEIEIYSLTDKRDGEPKVNIEVAITKASYMATPVSSPTVYQIRGPKNACPPIDPHLKPLVEFFRSQKDRGWRLWGHGCKNFDGKVDGDELARRLWQLHVAEQKKKEEASE